MPTFFTRKFVYEDVTVRSIDYLNWRKVLHVYADIILLVWKKVNEVFPANIYRLKVKKSDTKVGCERCFLKRH